MAIFFLLQLTLMSPFSTYKYHLCACRKTQQRQQTLKFSQSVLFFFFILSFKTMVFVRFRDLLLHLIDLTCCCILGEKCIWFGFVLCSRGIFSLRIALCVPQPKLSISFSHLYFISYYYYNCCVCDISKVSLLVLLELWLRTYPLRCGSR